MHVRIDIPQETEDALRREWGDLEQAAKEALLLESYRTGRVSIGFLAETLGLTRWDVERWLRQHGATWNYGLDDLESDRKTHADLFGEKL